mmetsp:Transcript_67416/g.190810  ORF Transcript_67416/g.190810 Transcript_67416/m.190810 type:complete len:215 (-) Transcript_67416:83-727(-)
MQGGPWDTTPGAAEQELAEAAAIKVGSTVFRACASWADSSLTCFSRARTRWPCEDAKASNSAARASAASEARAAASAAAFATTSSYSSSSSSSSSDSSSAATSATAAVAQRGAGRAGSLCRTPRRSARSPQLWTQISSSSRIKSAMGAAAGSRKPPMLSSGHCSSPLASDAPPLPLPFGRRRAMKRAKSPTVPLHSKEPGTAVMTAAWQLASGP